MSPQEAAKAWEQWIAPHKEAGSVLLSPSCALQQNEKWLAPFLAAVQTQPDYINVHVFKDKPEKIKETLDHYRKYGKKMWITERELESLHFFFPGLILMEKCHSSRLHQL